MPATMQRVLTPTDAAITAAAAALRAGRLVAFPTETVYGLGAIATLDRAVEAIYRAKGRPSFNPLIVHLASPDRVEDLAVVDDAAREAMARFWPGPLTLVLDARPDSPVAVRARGGLPSLAVRMPAHPVARALLEATALPVAAPSANPSGRVSATTAMHVAEDFGDAVDIVLDGGPAPYGVESTVLDLRDGNQPLLLRPGAVATEAIESALGMHLLSPLAAEARPTSPGQLASHYAPTKPLRLDAVTVSSDEALLAFGPVVPEGAVVTLNLSPSGNIAEAAHRLFAMLRELDRSAAGRIAAMPVPTSGLGAAINDRLQRAAAPR